MMRTISLQLSPAGPVIYINPAQIISIEPLTMSGSAIHLTDERTLTVTEKADKIADAIDKMS
jgi:hypothetical protein